MNRFGMVRITAVTPKVFIADPKSNAKEHLRIMEENRDTDIFLFPELSITGYTCGDLFHQTALLEETWKSIYSIAAEMHPWQLAVVGAPLPLGNALYNCAVVLINKQIVGIVPKQFIPNYNEFYERRHFAPGHMVLGKDCQIPTTSLIVPFGTDLLFRCSPGCGRWPVTIGIEVCESIWMPIPPSSIQAILGAVIHLNPSTSNDTVRKDAYRENLVIGQSGRCISAYAYASSGPTESTADIVCGGHRMIAEAGSMLANESSIMPVVNRESAWITADVDVERLWHERRVTTSYNESLEYVKAFEPRWINVALSNRLDEGWGLKRRVDATPFIPKDPHELSRRCRFITNMQTAGLAQRLSELPRLPRLVLGTSGGADSTHAACILRKTVDMMKIPVSQVLCFSLPGFGTTEETFKDSLTIPRSFGFEVRKHDIRPACFQRWKDMGHKPFGIDIATMPLDVFQEELKKLPPGSEDLVFENTQALYRTDFLFSHGFVIGTSDESESFLGWCTYNGDQQAAYHVNIGVPKTLIKWLIAYLAQSDFADHPVKEALVNVAGRRFSPELLPCDMNGKIVQITEEKIGPYEIHDFVMPNMLKNGYDPEKIVWLAEHAEGWEGSYDHETFKKWLEVAVRRFFGQQYKRENAANGPKVGSLALSPRGDLRMPPGARPDAWLQYLEQC